MGSSAHFSAFGWAALVTLLASGGCSRQGDNEAPAAGTAGIGTGGASAGIGGGAGSSTGGATAGSSGSGAGGSSGGTAGAGSGQGGSGAGAAGSSGRGGAAGEGGEAGEGGRMPDDRPILERPVREELDCEVTVPLAGLGFGWREGALAATSGGVFLAWTEPSVASAPDAAVITTLDTAGRIGEVRQLVVYGGAVQFEPRLAASARGMTLAWSEMTTNQMSALRVLELDAAGVVTKEPPAVAGLSERLSAPEVVPTADGNALLFVHSALDYSSSRLRFARLDADAAVVGQVTDLSTSEDLPRVGRLAAIPGGYAATFYPPGNEVESLLVFLDADGNVQGEPVALGRGRTALGQSLLVRGDELIVAFGAEEGSYAESNIAGYVGLARFDLATRALSAPVVRVQAPVVGEETVDPVLFALGQDVGLIWSRGGVIYVCGGCWPDNHLELVVMDGDDFTPLTELVTLPNVEPMGGFVRPKVALQGEHVVVAASQQLHISAGAASAVVRCVERP